MAEAAAGLSGMTVNARLAARNRQPDWRTVAAARDRAAMLRLLQRVAVPNAQSVVDTILADPTQYGL